MVSFGLTIAVMLPGIGVTVNGATRWLGAGPFQFQPSELLKVSLILYAAQLLAARPRSVLSVGGLVKPLLLVVGRGLRAAHEAARHGHRDGHLLLDRRAARGRGHADAEPRHDRRRARRAGAARWRSPSRTGASGSPRSSIRSRTPATSGFQAVQALTAIGSGGLFGVGLGESVQKIFYLPEAHTDMILAIIGEELGLVGILALIVLYGMIGYAGLRTAKLARDQYSKLLAAGITSLILCQATLNFFAVLGHDAADRGAAAVHLLRQLEPDRAARRDGTADGRRRDRRRGRAARAQAGPPRGRRRRRGASSAAGASRPSGPLSAEVPMPKVVIAAGGTAGHVVPALAVADELRERGVEVEFIGGERAEAELVPAAGYPLHTLRVERDRPQQRPARGRARSLLAAGATVRARRLLRRAGADAVLGGGGYVAGPVGLAARSLRLPLVLTEADSHLGVTNRLLAPLARRASASPFRCPAATARATS